MKEAQLFSDDILWKKIGDESLLRHLNKGGVYKVNGVGTLILELMQQGIPDKEIIKMISSRYGVREKHVMNDFSQFKKMIRGTL